MSFGKISKREFVAGGLGLTVANFLPYGPWDRAYAQGTMEERTIAAAKAAGKADVTGIMWAPYLKPMY